VPGSSEGGVIAPIRLQKEGAAIPFPDASFCSPVSVTWLSNGARAVSDRSASAERHPRKGIVGEWRGARRRVLPYENNAHSYRLTVAKLAQSKINIRSFSHWVGYWPRFESDV
jgi:hypothetical protein